MTQLQVPTRPGTRCKLGVVMWNHLGYRHQTDWIEALMAEIPRRDAAIAATSREATVSVRQWVDDPNAPLIVDGRRGNWVDIETRRVGT